MCARRAIKVVKMPRTSHRTKRIRKDHIDSNDKGSVQCRRFQRSLNRSIEVKLNTIMFTSVRETSTISYAEIIIYLFYRLLCWWPIVFMYPFEYHFTFYTLVDIWSQFRCISRDAVATCFIRVLVKTTSIVGSQKKLQWFSTPFSHCLAASQRQKPQQLVSGVA